MWKGEDTDGKGTEKRERYRREERKVGSREKINKRGKLRGEKVEEDTNGKGREKKKKEKRDKGKREEGYEAGKIKNNE